MATKQYVDYTEEEYFDAEVSLDGEDIKLTPKNDRTLNFTGTILINGSEPQTGAEVQADWAETDDTKADFIKNKPTIPAAQIQSDWSQTDSAEVDYIKNKPTIPSVGTDYVQPSSIGATIALDSEKYYNLGTISSDLTISFTSPASGKVGIYAGEFIYSTSTPAPTVTFPNGILWKETVTYADGKLYQFSVVNNKGVISEFTIA